MAEFTGVALQEVQTNANVLFTETPIAPSKCIRHRQGSGIVTLKGLTQQNCFARFQVTFNGNISVPAGETAQAISVAIAIDGEQVQSSIATVTPTVADALFNVTSTAIIDVPKCCCDTISVKNISPIAINIQNANFVVERVA